MEVYVRIAANQNWSTGGQMDWNSPTALNRNNIRAKGLPAKNELSGNLRNFSKEPVFEGFAAGQLLVLDCMRFFA
jgi:hypothetical protein